MRTTLPVALALLASVLTTGSGTAAEQIDSWEDVTVASGIDGPLTSSYLHAAMWGDVDGNGWPDLFAGTFVTGPTVVPNTLLLNDAGQFNASPDATLSAEGRAAGGVLADLDGDGDLDIVVSNNRKPNRSGAPALESKLYRNDGGAFTDVTAGSGLDAQTSNGRQVSAFDHDGDGDLDLLIVGDDLTGSGPTVLLRNEGAFTFTDVTTAAGLPSNIHGLGSAVGDVDRDGWPDLFIAGGPTADDNRNYLFMSNADGTYRDATPTSLDWNQFETGNEDWVSSGAFGDVDLDGDLDLLIGHHFGSAVVAEVPTPVRLYRNDGVDGGGDPIFTDITIAAGLPGLNSKAPHVDIQDFDNDGLPDLYVSLTVDTPTGVVPLIMRNLGDGTFDSPDLVNEHYYPGGPVADYDRDGRLDVFLPEFRSVFQGTRNDEGVVPSLLLRNTSASGSWLDVEVAGSAMGVGAVVEIYATGDVGGVLLGMDEVALGYGFSSASEASVHFGLGAMTAVDVVVTLPRQQGVIVIPDVAADQRLVVDAGAPPPPPPPPPPPAAVPTASWSFETGSGSVATDGSGNEHDMTLVDGVTWGAGVAGGGVAFDGAAGRLVGSGESVDGLDDLSVAMWMKTTKTAGRQTLVSGLGSGNANEFEVRLLGSTRLLIHTGEGNSRAVLTIPSMANGTWHHLVVVRDGTADQVTLYIDGVVVASTSVTLNPLAVDQLVIGNDLKSVNGVLARSTGFSGSLDEVQIYDVALTAAEVAVLP